MKSIKTIIGALLLMLGAIGIASCNQEEDNILMQEKANLLKIVTSITETKAIVTGTEFKNSNQICVITPWNVSYFNNLATYQNGNWEMEEEVALPESSSVVGAIYPYEAELRRERVSAAGVAWWVYRQDVDLTYKVDGQTDYLYGLSTNEVSLSDGTARIRFQHALARITLALTKGSSDVGEGVVSKVILRNRSAEDFYAVISNKGVFTVDPRFKNGYINGNKDAAATIEVPAECTLSSTVTQSIDMLVIPTSINEDAEFVLTIDGSDYTFIIPQSEWEAGQQYTYPITINRHTVPTPEPTVGEAVYMGFNGDNGEPLYWSSWNLGATSPEDYGGLYGWADPTGLLTSIDLDDYPNTNPPTDISGTEYDIARQIWGGGWRIPSNNEFWSLLARSEAEWTYVNGVEGIRYTSTINGNSIFIPMAPIRIEETVEQGSQSYYWLGNLNDEDPTMAGTFYIDSYWDNDWPTAGQPRYYGLPIRPVTEQP